MSEQELMARIAAQATQIALLHNACKALKAEHLVIVGNKALAAVVQIDAAMNASEGDCHKLLSLTRLVAMPLHGSDDKTIAFHRTMLINLLDRLEGKPVVHT